MEQAKGLPNYDVKTGITLSPQLLPVRLANVSNAVS